METRSTGRTIGWVAFVLVIIGALNWLLVGLFQFDVVAAIFGSPTALSRIVYIYLQQTVVGPVPVTPPVGAGWAVTAHVPAVTVKLPSASVKRLPPNVWHESQAPVGYVTAAVPQATPV